MLSTKNFEWGKVDNSCADNDLEIEDNVVNRKDRTVHDGVVAIYLHKSIQYTLRHDLKGFNLETIAAELKLPHVKPIVIVTSIARWKFLIG